jgi:hypothetical protein
MHKHAFFYFQLNPTDWPTNTKLEQRQQQKQQHPTAASAPLLTSSSLLALTAKGSNKWNTPTGRLKA